MSRHAGEIGQRQEHQGSRKQHNPPLQTLGAASAAGQLPARRGFRPHRRKQRAPTKQYRTTLQIYFCATKCRTTLQIKLCRAFDVSWFYSRTRTWCLLFTYFLLWALEETLDFGGPDRLRSPLLATPEQIPATRIFRSMPPEHMPQGWEGEPRKKTSV